MEHDFQLIQKGFVPLSKDTHQFTFKNVKYIFDSNSLYSFKVNDLFSEMLLLDNELSPEEVSSVLCHKFNSDEVEKSITDLKKIQQRGVFISYKELPDVPYIYKTYKLSLDVCHTCNLNCRYCYSKVIDNIKYDKYKMTEKVAKKSIDFLMNDFGSKADNYEVNIVGGGEPLFNFDLIKWCRQYCLDLEQKIGKRIVFWIFTNGTTFTTDIIKCLADNKQSLTISIDGPKEIHDFLRPYPNGKGTYDVIKKYIEKIKKDSMGRGGVENLWASTVITSKHRGLKDILIEFVNLGIKNAQIRPVRSTEESLCLNDECIDDIKREYIELVEFLINKTIEGDLRYLKVILSERDFLGRYILRLMFRKRIVYRCDAAKSQICVLANGDIYPCDISCGTPKLKIGNINNTPPINPELQKPYFDQAVTVKDTCKNCWAKLLCGGGCYYSAYLKNQTIYKPDHVICELIRFVIELSIVFINEIKFKNSDIAKKIYRYAQLKQNVVEPRDKIKSL